jgi:hypothetical protein
VGGWVGGGDEAQLDFCRVGWPSRAGCLYTAACHQAMHLALRCCLHLLQEVCRVANWLRSVGVKKGDSVAVYMPMVCEVS